MQKWQMIWPWAKDDKAWAYDTEGDWCVKGVDPFWNGKRYPDGRHEGFIDVPDGHQELCYNETDCKLNWQYFRLLIDTEKYEYVEMQCQDKVMDLGALSEDDVKQMMSGQFEIETEMTIHALDRRFLIREIPVAYRDRPQGSVSKLNTISDGISVLKTIMTLYKEYRPLRFFSQKIP